MRAALTLTLGFYAVLLLLSLTTNGDPDIVTRVPPLGEVWARNLLSLALMGALGWRLPASARLPVVLLLSAALALALVPQVGGRTALVIASAAHGVPELSLLARALIGPRPVPLLALALGLLACAWIETTISPQLGFG